jgi:hypothetical protein
MDARNLPASWSSTANSMESLAFYCKDAALVVDDFAPCGTAQDVHRKHADADRLLRAQGNSSGRGRLTAESTMQQERPPRGLIVSTGEDVPRGHSAVARSVVVEVAPGSLDFGKLTTLQRAAEDGSFARAMAGFIAWLAGGLERHQARLKGLQEEYRGQLREARQHARTPSNAASLLAGWKFFLEFAQQAGAITERRSAAYWGRGLAALGKVAGCQESHVASDDPAGRFMELLSSVLSSGRAHVVSTSGGVPAFGASALGWRTSANAYGERIPTPQGERVGWVDEGGGELLLDEQAAYAAAQHLAGQQHSGQLVTRRTLWRRLHERGLLVIDCANKTRFKVRRTVEGERRYVLCLPLTGLGVDRPQAQGGEAMDDVGKEFLDPPPTSP